MLALSVTAIICLIFSFQFDFLGFKAGGQSQTINILNSIGILIEQDYVLLAVIQALAIVLLPCVILIALVYILIPLQLGKRPYHGDKILALVFRLLPWSMAEIFLVGVLISLIKISSLADITIGLSFYTYIAFVLCLIMTLWHMDRHQMMEVLEGSHQPQLRPVNRSQSTQKTWALLATAVIMYIPANVFPIMNTRTLGQDEPSTILGGVVLLWQMGSYPIAMVIFFASVFVPVAKLIVLAWLNFSVQKNMALQEKERTFLYRVTEFIGRWSMIDVFVVAILVSLVQLGNAMSIYPGPAALAFCGCVILTMLAAMTFDERLIWNTEREHA